MTAFPTRRSLRANKGRNDSVPQAGAAKVSLEFGMSFVRIPLETSPNVMHCDALETYWSELLPAGECSHVFGNPPFAGSKQRTPEQSRQVKRIAGKAGPAADLDCGAAWFILTGRYAQEGGARIAFVSTNSIAQGEQAGKLWPMLYGMGLEISFAHRTCTTGRRCPAACLGPTGPRTGRWTGCAAGGRRYASDADRLQRLLAEYEGLAAPPARNGSIEL